MRALYEVDIIKRIADFCSMIKKLKYYALHTPRTLQYNTIGTCSIKPPSRVCPMTLMRLSASGIQEDTALVNIGLDVRLFKSIPLD